MEHGDSTNNHRLERWVFPNSGARTAMTGYPAPAAKDVGKVAYQQDNNTYWRLTNWNPVQWSSVAGALAPGTITRDDLDFDILTTDDLTAHLAITPTQNTNGHISWELLEDHLNAILSAAAPLVLTYNDGANTFALSVNTEQLAEIIDDRVAALLIAGDGIQLVYNDAANSLRVINTGSGTGGGGGETGETVITSAGDLIRGGNGGDVRSDEYTNLATSGTAAAGIGGSWSNVANVVDGNDATYAEIVTMSANAGIAITFATNQQIASFRLLSDGDFPFQLESSTDGAVWTLRRRMYAAPQDTGRIMLDAAVNARYWRVRYFGTINPIGPWKIYTLELHSKPPVMPTNVGLASAGAVADAIDQAAIYQAPSYINDNEDLGERGVTITAKGNRAWFSLELPAPARIVAFRVQETDASQAGGYTLQSSTNGTNWTDRHHYTDVRASTGVVYLASPTEAKYWRIIGDTDPLHTLQWSVSTFSVYSEPGAAAGDPERYPIGTNGQVLTVVSGMPAWANPTGGGSDYDLYGHIEGGAGISVAWDEEYKRYSVFINNGTLAMIAAAVTPSQLATALASYALTTHTHTVRKSAQWFVKNVVVTTDGVGQPFIVDQTGAKVIKCRLLLPANASADVTVAVQRSTNQGSTWANLHTTAPKIASGATFGGANAVWSTHTLNEDDLLRVNVTGTPADAQNLTISITMEVPV